MPTWRVPLSAHVCTTDDAPAIERADIFLEIAPEKQAHAQVLWSKYYALKPSAYRDAVFAGYCALERVTGELVGHIISRGALLHYGCPRALTLAEVSQELRATRLLQKRSDATC